MMAHVGDVNLFGMRVVAVKGRTLDLECQTCRSTGVALADDFQSTRCGSAACASSQGRTE
jgi:hypothetical protein